MRGDACGEVIEACCPHWRDETTVWTSIISISRSKGCSGCCAIGFVLSWDDGCRCDSLLNGGESSSSEESGGVMVCVNMGTGLFFDDRERVRTCLVIGEVRKGKLHDLWKVHQ